MFFYAVTLLLPKGYLVSVQALSNEIDRDD